MENMQATSPIVLSEFLLFCHLINSAAAGGVKFFLFHCQVLDIVGLVNYEGPQFAERS